MEGLYTVQEAAAYLDLTPGTVKYHYYTSKRLKGEKLGPIVVFKQEELDAFRNQRHPRARCETTRQWRDTERRRRGR